jgi:hypothetical protein
VASASAGSSDGPARAAAAASVSPPRITARKANSAGEGSIARGPAAPGSTQSLASSRVSSARRSGMRAQSRIAATISPTAQGLASGATA